MAAPSGAPAQKKRTWARRELEGGRNGRESIVLNLDAFTNKNVIDIFHLKARNTVFEKGITLGELVFEMFSVATEGESLTMSVFLVTGGSGGRANQFRVLCRRRRRDAMAKGYSMDLRERPASLREEARRRHQLRLALLRSPQDHA